MASLTPTTDAYEAAKAIESLNKLTSTDTLKMLDDVQVDEMILHSSISSVYPLASYQNALTFFNTPEMIYAEKSRVSGILLIIDAMTPRTDTETHHFIHALEIYIDNQFNNSQKGHRQTLMLEHGIRLNTPAPQEKRGILGRLRG
jgi:hypothetical protein